MHQLWQHPNGTFYVLYGPRLRKRISTRSKDRRTAETFLSQFIAGSQSPIVQAPTVGEILVGYRNSRTAEVRSPKSLAGSVAAVFAKLSDLRPEHLTPATIKRYARERMSETVPRRDRKVSAGTVLREIGALRAALSWAVGEKWITANDVPSIANPVPTPRSRDRWLTRDEAVRLLDAVREPHVKLFVRLGLMTYARTAAILEAQWGQVDWDTRRIDYGEGHGNKRRAVVPLNDDIYASLKAAKELACSDYIVEYRGKKLKTIKRGFGEACRRAKIEGVTPHILRHSAATWAAMAGVPMEEIARMLGDTLATTERTYAKWHPDYLKRAANAVRLTAPPSQE